MIACYARKLYNVINLSVTNYISPRTTLKIERENTAKGYMVEPLKRTISAAVSDIDNDR